MVRLRAGGSTAAGLLNWGAKLPTNWLVPCICELLIGLGPFCIIFMRKVKFRLTAGTPSPAPLASLQEPPPQHLLPLPFLAFCLTQDLLFIESFCSCDCLLHWIVSTSRSLESWGPGQCQAFRRQTRHALNQTTQLFCFPNSMQGPQASPCYRAFALAGPL